MKVLMVITSHEQLDSTGRKTGFWLEELAAPYYVFKDAGAGRRYTRISKGRPTAARTRRATSTNSAQTLPPASKMTKTRKPDLIRLSAFIPSGRKTSTLSSAQAAAVLCGSRQSLSAPPQ
jgi:hypothetical protein